MHAGWKSLSEQIGGIDQRFQERRVRVVPEEALQKRSDGTLVVHHGAQIPEMFHQHRQHARFL